MPGLPKHSKDQEVKQKPSENNNKPCQLLLLLLSELMYIFFFLKIWSQHRSSAGSVSTVMAESLGDSDWCSNVHCWCWASGSDRYSTPSTCVLAVNRDLAECEMCFCLCSVQVSLVLLNCWSCSQLKECLVPVWHSAYFNPFTAAKVSGMKKNKKKC